MPGYRAPEGGRSSGLRSLGLRLRWILRRPTTEIELVGIAAVDIAGIVGRYTLDTDLNRLQNERAHDAVARAADPDAGAIRRIGFISRTVRHIEHVVLFDEQAARTSKLPPFVKILAILVEDLDAVVAAISD